MNFCELVCVFYLKLAGVIIENRTVGYKNDFGTFKSFCAKCEYKLIFYHFS